MTQLNVITAHERMGACIKNGALLIRKIKQIQKSTYSGRTMVGLAIELWPVRFDELA